MVDYFTKWCEAIAMPNQEAVTIVTVIVNEWISRYGAPSIIHSDQGPSFDGLLLRELCRFLGIQKTRTTPYHPQGNELVERTNRTLKDILRSFVEQSNSHKWDEVLPRCLLAYRGLRHTSTGFTPAHLTFGRELRLPAEVVTPLAPREAIDLTAYNRKLMEDLFMTHHLAHQHLELTQKRQKSSYDATAHGPTYRLGDYVWLHRPRPPPGQAAAFHSP
ncbi:Retrovirus Pol polyprotein from transposon [Fasciola gigantica]|uniref:Retrovirus Pol polyprotein from transposon n=1 Tax=Fasciola gigantica TaxID=46835 RepID=A0A504YM86_FASGI|nr:Retrovirus Pol polyprotein from transposon [Fasciola gigantica]